MKQTKQRKTAAIFMKQVHPGKSMEKQDLFSKQGKKINKTR